MIQIEYRNGFCVIDGSKTSYYKMINGVLTNGVSGKMARALESCKVLLGLESPFIKLPTNSQIDKE